MIDCHSPQHNNISSPIYQSTGNFRSDCIHSSKEQNLNFQTEFEGKKNDLTYQINSKEPLSPTLNYSKNQKVYLNSYRNSTPDISRIRSKTYELFNLNKKKYDRNCMNKHINDNEIIENNNNTEMNKKYFDSKLKIDVQKHNSLNFIYKNRPNNNKDAFSNKKNELLEKIRCISQRLDNTIFDT